MRIFLPLFLLVSAYSAQAQFRSSLHALEAGIMLGVAGYSGDVSAGRTDLQELRPGYGFFVRYFLSPHFALNGHVYAGAISGNDKYSEIKSPRSFSFGTSLFELAGVLEWHLIGQNRSPGASTHDFFISPYVFAGAGIVFTDADVLYYGPPDARSQFVIAPLPEPGLKSRFLVPMAGGGIRVMFSERLSLGLEGGLRPTFSDGIDGVSVNGNPAENDWYYFAGGIISVMLN